ncbi:hypothetical protein [Alteromonas gilva]|uniref:CYTH domain-containing protein n=1 Tax=Alteromonas gilva TaxID=2987522 RepID=A0ABT5L116_9ALTE|nr:hypothetical protein [Alteromonas gilva]MDC8830091.1 hypothetical protein [Alteromonas gilva]
MRDQRLNERKFVITYLPEGLLRKKRSVCVREGYLTVHNERQVHISDYGGQYTMTIRQGKRLKVTEAEISLSDEQFNDLWPLTQHMRIEKSRYRIERLGYKLSVDVFRQHLEGLMLAAVEFDSEVDCRRFLAPDFTDFEVTHRREYQNEQLARLGMPDTFAKASMSMV